MAYEFRLPDLGEGLTEGEISRWLVSEGQDIAEDDPLVEIQTDKTTVEIPSPAGGKVTRILVAEGEVIPVGTVLVVIGGEPDGGRAPAEREAADASSAVSPPTPAPSAGRGRATPLVRKIAQELGVDLDTLQGTGQGSQQLPEVEQHLDEVRLDPHVLGEATGVEPGGAEALAQRLVAVQAAATLAARRVVVDRHAVADRHAGHLTPDLDQPLIGQSTGNSWDFQPDKQVLDVLEETERVATASDQLAEGLQEYTGVSPIQSGGDLDADWERDEAVGEEGVGGSVPTPDQDRVDELGAAVGIEYQDEEPLHTTEKLENRDRHRWELNPASDDTNE